MYERVYRYDKPVQDVFLDILNYTNNTGFTHEQLEIGLPQAVDFTQTRVKVSPSKKAGWIGSVTVSYDRFDLNEFFGEVLPLVIWVEQKTAEGIFRALKEQYRIEFSAADFVLTPQNPNLDAVVATQDMNGFEPGHIDEVPDFDLETVVSFDLVAKSTNLVWVGRTKVLIREKVAFLGQNVKTVLDIKRYFFQTQEQKVPVELVIDREKDATPFSALLKHFANDDVLNETTSFTEVARSLTGDAWRSVQATEDFNLFGAKVLYNGYNQGVYFTGLKRFSHVLALELSETHCKNLKGIWLVHYHDKNAEKFSDYRIDRGPMLGQ